MILSLGISSKRLAPNITTALVFQTSSLFKNNHPLLNTTASKTTGGGIYPQKKDNFSYLLHWDWSDDQLCSSSICHLLAASLVHCIPSTAAEDSQVIHFVWSCYTAQNLHSLVAVYLSHGGQKL